jgi:hypothetical protein
LAALIIDSFSSSVKTSAGIFIWFEVDILDENRKKKYASFGILFKRVRKFTAMLSDERKSFFDMILGILVVKLYAWEVPFIRKIISIRDNELKYIWKSNIQKAVSETLFSSPTLLINLAGLFFGNPSNLLRNLKCKMKCLLI